MVEFVDILREQGAFISKKINNDQEGESRTVARLSSFPLQEPFQKLAFWPEETVYIRFLCQTSFTMWGNWIHEIMLSYKIILPCLKLCTCGVELSSIIWVATTMVEVWWPARERRKICFHCALDWLTNWLCWWWRLVWLVEVSLW